MVLPVQSVADLPDRLAEKWRAATRHQFILGARDGSLAAASFDVWLVQDYRFVIGLEEFQSRLADRLSPPTRSVVLTGVAALSEELAWFERQAEDRGVVLSVSPAPATTAYLAMLDRLDSAAPAAALAALWAIERIYLDAWRTAAPGAPAYRTFVAHWTNAEFALYVEELAAAADVALAATDPPLDPIRPVSEILDLEVRFWDYAAAGAE